MMTHSRQLNTRIYDWYMMTHSRQLNTRIYDWYMMTQIVDN